MNVEVFLNGKQCGAATFGTLPHSIHVILWVDSVRLDLYIAIFVEESRIFVRVIGDLSLTNDSPETNLGPETILIVEFVLAYL